MAAPALAPRAGSWQRFLDELDWWIERHGDAVVPQSGVSSACGESYPLGRRVKAYRVAYRQRSLAGERVEQLEAREGWTWDGFGGRASRAWDQNLEAVRAHVRLHGGLDGLERADAPAARWLRDQRAADLTAEQQRELATIPGALIDRRGRLDTFITALLAWTDDVAGRDASALRYSTLSVVDGAAYPLGKRAAYWRARHAEGHLAPDEVAALAEVPGWRW